MKYLIKGILAYQLTIAIITVSSTTICRHVLSHILLRFPPTQAVCFQILYVSKPPGLGNVVLNSPPPSNSPTSLSNRAVRSWWKIGLQLGVVIVLGNMQEFQRFWKLDRWLTRRLGLRCFLCFGVFFFLEIKDCGCFLHLGGW